MGDADLDELLLALGHAPVRFVVVGGIAVGVHGYVRGTKDLDLCPDPEPANLTALAALLRDLEAEQVEVGDFAPGELPFDPLDPRDLAQGGNFRLRTRLGALDIMQSLPGIDADHAYPVLAQETITIAFRGVEIQVCSLAHLRLMKETAGRPQDRVDLENLPES